MIRRNTPLLAAIAALALCASGMADTIRMRAAVRIAPDAAITLADIADLDGAAIVRLGSTKVGRGETGAFVLSSERVRQQLVVAGADMRRIDIEGTQTIVRPLRGAVPEVEAPAKGPRIIDPSKEAGTHSALALICEMMRNAYGDDASSLRLECSQDQLARIAPVPGVRYEVIRKTTLRSSRVEFEVVAHEPAGGESRARVRLTPKLEREVLVARGDARRGDRADDDSLARERQLLELDAAKDAITPDEARGATFARSVNDGKVIARGDLVRASDVKRRDTVTVRHEVGMVAIEFEAVALEDGARGDVISIERNDRRRSRDSKPLSAEVVAPGRVVIRSTSFDR